MAILRRDPGDHFEPAPAFESLLIKFRIYIIEICLSPGARQVKFIQVLTGSGSIGDGGAGSAHEEEKQCQNFRIAKVIFKHSGDQQGRPAAEGGGRGEKRFGAGGVRTQNAQRVLKGDTP